MPTERTTHADDPLRNRKVPRNSPCPCGSGRKFKRCCIDAAAPTTPAPGGPAAYVSLIVETAEGLFERRVPNASPLRREIPDGKAAEEATHDAAALWGMPDFVFSAEPHRKASGSREVGDATILVGALGAVVQVKSREAVSGDPEKELRWLRKNVKKALSQGDGTIRTLRAGGVQLTNARGASIDVDPAAYLWIVVVVVNHDDLPDGAVIDEVSGTTNPSVVLSRRDWEFLFQQLKSTYAVVSYLRRVSGTPATVGREHVRYYEYALADEQAAPEVLEAGSTGVAPTVSHPLLPTKPAGAGKEDDHRLVRGIFEDIAVTEIEGGSEADRLESLAQLDRLPVQQRAEVGRYLLSSLTEVTAGPADEVRWKMRRFAGNVGAPHLAVAVCSQMNPVIHSYFADWVQLRHHDRQALSGEGEELKTVGVLLTPRQDGAREWDTTMVAVSGLLTFDDAELAELRRLFPVEPAAA